MAKFQVCILGCGSATPSLRHQPSCQVIDFRGRLMMIDCGEGAQLQMRRMKLKFSRLSHIFISHIHGDHFLGLPGLLSTLSLHEKGGSINIYAFEEGISILKKIMSVFCRDTSFEIKYNVIKREKKIVYEDDSVSVETFPLYHSAPCVGYIFREKPKARHLRGDMIRFHGIPVSRLEGIRHGDDFVTDDGSVIPNDRLTLPAEPSVSYAYCSDTAFSPSVAEAVRGVDVIYHEATYADDLAGKASQRGHSTARQAGKIAAMAGAGRLIIGHYSKLYLSNDQLLAEAGEEFPDVTAADEGLRIDLL